MAKLFISYSHRDERALESLHNHFSMLRRDGLIEEWFDRKILAGGGIDDEIESNLCDSDIFLPLVSPDFLASDYCYEREMKEALRRNEEGSIRVVPIVLEPCDWKSSPLGKLKALPKDGKPISLWMNENTAYLDVSTELRRILTSTPQSDDSDARTTSVADTKSGNIGSKRYRIRREFDSIDRDEFREKAFAIIRDYFRRSIDELNEIGDPIRARFEPMGDHAFTCTVLNKANRTQEAHITVHSDGSSTFGGDISYSFSRRAPNDTANGFIRVTSNEYELYLKLDNFAFIRTGSDEPQFPEEAAEALWHEFVSHAGVDHD